MQFSDEKAVFDQEANVQMSSQAPLLSLNNLALTLGTTGKDKQSFDLFMQAQRITDGNIENVFSIATEQQKLAFVKTQNAPYFGTLSLIHRRFSDDQQALRAGLDLVLSRKGIVFDAQARQQEAIAASLDPDVKGLWDQLSGKRANLARLLQNRPEKMSAEAYKASIGGLHGKIGQLEARLTSKSALVAQQLKQRQVTSQELAKHLDQSTLLAEFVKVADYDWKHGKWPGSSRYLVFILNHDGKVQMVDLGDANKLEEAIAPGLAALGDATSSRERQIGAAGDLYARLWQPLAAATQGVKRIVLSPDGLLNLAPFGAMRDKDGKYLIERMTLSYVTSGRDLAKGDVGIRPDSELLLVADPAFGLNVEQMASAVAGQRGQTRSRGFDMSFPRLPGTRREAEKIPALLRGKGKQVMTGKAATEAAVLNAGHPRILHLATHGFFLRDQAALGVSKGQRGISIVATDRPAAALPKGYENPLVRSGLALAGANHAREAGNSMDGLLTALEVSGMNLHGTDLVTLSACETGVGSVQTGEGVFGLRRAFALSGVKNLMMSLWAVSDEITAEQMLEFYRLYGEGQPAPAALRKAQLQTIAQLRQRYGSAAPNLWAPFIMQGKLD